ncbi:pilus assembly protein TadG-related protein [Defluviimonas sp. WL0024]|uniref:Pilus assembly protein TadG-related protein n=1 Tax=Albidovulum salinarum TaxID=2984153 RepID=A0ABT2X1I2_9RHOB|nr:TadE/TadG family type IV pilus assembly protein [Defluviimonas sp. WL0024]MCU9847803.1 pilus assembly protein TadG-related protein [Defluviimonas sp. WL0024]
MSQFRIAPDGAVASRAALRGLHARLARFRQAEDGSLVIFGLFTFVIMLMLTGVALDLMRFEERRTVLQNTIDSAARAATAPGQTLPPEEVVRDHFVKAGLTPPTNRDIIVTRGTDDVLQQVEIRAAETLDTWFADLAGVSTLTAPASSRVKEDIGQIEISLVLDVSGSMNGNGRLGHLKEAAKTFVEQVFAAVEPGNVSISIVPYATQVAMPTDLASHFNMTVEHDSSACIEFSDAVGVFSETESDFTTTAVAFGFGPDDRRYQRNGHFDPFRLAAPPEMTNCPTGANREILPFSGDRAALVTFIDGLEAEGNTSIDIGMKWGSALLDPSMRGVVEDMVGKGKLPLDFVGRPHDFAGPHARKGLDVLKVIVLLTDGANSAEYRLRNNDDGDPYYDEGMSPLWRNAAYRTDPGDELGDDALEQYSLFDPQSGKFYVFALQAWRDSPWGDAVYDADVCTGSGETETCGMSQANDAGFDGTHPMAQQMTWPEVWSSMSMFYFSDEIIYGAYQDRDLRNQWRPDAEDPVANTSVANTAAASTKDARTLAVCDAAKDPGRDIRIFSIAFEAPVEGQKLLSACQNSGFYAVDGKDISDAFAGIAGAITKLRLTH